MHTDKTQPSMPASPAPSEELSLNVETIRDLDAEKDADQVKGGAMDTSHMTICWRCDPI